MLSAAELAIHRATIAAQLMGRCTVASVTDASGAQTWGTPAACDCIVGQPSKGNAVDHTEYTGSEPGVTIWLPVAQAVKAGDRIVDSRNTKSYKVMHVPSLHSDELLRACVCVEVRTAGANA